MAVVKRFNVNKEQATFDADIIENMSANDVSYDDSFQYDENTVGNKLSKLEDSVDILKNSGETVNGVLDITDLSVDTAEQYPALDYNFEKGKKYRFRAKSNISFRAYLQAVDGLSSDLRLQTIASTVTEVDTTFVCKENAALIKIFKSSASEDVLKAYVISGVTLDVEDLKETCENAKDKVVSSRSYDIAIGGTQLFAIKKTFVNGHKYNIKINSTGATVRAYLQNISDINSDNRLQTVTDFTTEFNSQILCNVDAEYLIILCSASTTAYEVECTIIDNIDTKIDYLNHRIDGIDDSNKELSNEINDIESELGGISDVELSICPHVNGRVRGDNVYVSTTSEFCYKVSVQNCVEISVTIPEVSATSTITFVENVVSDTPVTGDAVLLATGETGARTLAVGINSIKNIPSNAKYALVFNSATYPISSISVNRQGLKYDVELLKEHTPIAENDFEYAIPGYIFGIQNACSSIRQRCRDYVQMVSPESFVGADKLTAMNVNGKNFVNLSTQTVLGDDNTFNVNKNSIVLTGDNYKRVTIGGRYQVTKSSVARNKSIRYLAIGDSITEDTAHSLDGTSNHAWNYWSWVKEFSILDNIDYGNNDINVLTVGTKVYSDRTFSYKNETKTLRGRCEGRGGWTTATYLRHATRTECTANSAPFNNKAAWDALGLGTKQLITASYNPSAVYTEWVSNDTNKNLVRTTCWGYYHWDYSTELWDALKKQNPNNLFSSASAYTESTSDKSLIDSGMNWIMEHPDNPFYDSVTARDGDHAFSMTKYLGRYKTLADDGTTRLIVGSTAGTEISSSNINSIDVCTPTHVTIELGTNDITSYNATATQIKDDVDKINSIVKSALPNAYVGIMMIRCIGVFNPSAWSDVAVCTTLRMTGSALIKYQMHKAYIADYPTLYNWTRKDFYIPSYTVMNGLTDEQGRYIDSFMTENKKMIMSGDDSIHPGNLGHQSIGYQVWAWILYTLTL